MSFDPSQAQLQPTKQFTFPDKREDCERLLGMMRTHRRDVLDGISARGVAVFRHDGIGIRWVFECIDVYDGTIRSLQLRVGRETESSHDSAH